MHMTAHNTLIINSIKNLITQKALIGTEPFGGHAPAMVVVASVQSLAAGAPKVLLLSGQPTASSGAPADRALPVMVLGQQGASPEGASRGPPQARKPQRLTHLNPEEKALRRKLKNRKAQMSELEQQVVDLEEENQKLLLENQPRGMVAWSAESAALRLRTSAAGAGPVVTHPEHLPMDSDGIDSSDSESDLLLGILFDLDPVMFLRCPSPESASLEQLPEVDPEGPTKLEAINELIRFDHVYIKPLVLEMPSETESQANVVVKIEEATFSPSEKDHPEFTVSVKEELVEDDFIPELGISSAFNQQLPEAIFLPAGCLQSSLPPSWEDPFASELFPQLISV
ncbi:hypothetical protein FD755_011566 [Muntiacus reevesi]|uniref:BZIP domain-containing protein n=1 Tax=Muntiacus reevesi TaxID=9886 RepID=A0A5N3XTH0_MUNRE|nr:hypothetical protein FD755_011566 [Muntiacus reevesi]